MSVRKGVYRALGLVCVFLGGLGAFLPLLPTTPFLLLALWFFSRSSPRMRRWLLTNRFFGSYLRDYRSGRGISATAKTAVLTLMWASMLFAIFYVAKPLWLKISLALIAVGVTIHVLWIRTNRNCTKESSSSLRRRPR